MLKTAVVILALGGLLLGTGIGLLFLAQKQGLAEIAEEIRSTIAGQVRTQPAQAVQVHLQTTHFGQMIIQIPSAIKDLVQHPRTPVRYIFSLSTKERTLSGEWRDKKNQWHPLYENMIEKSKKIEYKIPANTPFALSQEFQDWEWGDVDLLRYTLKTQGESDFVWHVTPGEKG